MTACAGLLCLSSLKSRTDAALPLYGTAHSSVAADRAAFMVSVLPRLSL